MKPVISKSAHIAKESILIGDVHVGNEATVLYYAVLRGDNGRISVGERTNIQEHCVLHTDPGHQVLIGNNVTVGHGCILHGCQIDDETMIGMGSGSLVTENTVIPDGFLALGRPAKPIRPLNQDQLAMLKESAAEYVETGRKLLD